jgi:hypothetical protein
MMSTTRASIFDDELDVSEFTPSRPTRSADKEGIRAVAEKRGFQAREPVPEQARAPQPTAARRQQRRHTTGRNRQLNIKATQATIDRFYALADRHGWVLGEAFERAIDALEQQSGQGS